jgi:diketogulonate reductase-like aldo/keto reductase
VGIAIKESKIPRSDLYITTKVMDGTDDIEAALRASLKKLQLDHVDLYLLHSPYFAYEGAAKADPAAALRSAWATMASLRAAGLAASVGVSNFLPEHLAAMLDGGDGEEPTPAVNQVELHGYLPRAALVADCRARGVAVAAYGALAPVTSGSPGPLDATLAALARKYAVTPSEVCLRWAIDQRIAVVTTSGKEQRLSDYLRATKFKLTPAEVKEISEKGAEKHYRRFWAGKFAADNRL